MAIFLLYTMNKNTKKQNIVHFSSSFKPEVDKYGT